MCIASLWPAGVEINYQALLNGAEVNDDGHGFAIASKERGLEVFKSMHIDETLAALEKKRAEFGENSIVVFHSRWATHGETSEFNVHPFYTNASGETVMVHNGVLPTKYHPGPNDPRSDTQIFADRVLHEYTVGGVPSRRQAKALGSLIGTGNKLIFLSVRGGEPKARIVNAYLGEHAHGAWFSNSGYLPSRWTYNWTKAPAPGRSLVLHEDDYSEEKGVDDYGLYRYESLECPTCYAIGSIEVDTMICAYCEHCYDCSASIDECQCWVGSAYAKRSHDEIEPTTI